MPRDPRAYDPSAFLDEHAHVEHLTKRGWVQVSRVLATYLTDRAPAVPRILLITPTASSEPSRASFVPGWAALLLEAGSQLKEAALSVGGVRKGSKGAPPDETLVNWPRVLTRAAGDRAFRRALYALVESGECSPVGLRDWLHSVAPECFGR